MMMFQDAQFPKVAQLVRTKIIGMDQSSRVFKALVEVMESETLAKQFISPGTYPRLLIKPVILATGMMAGARAGGAFRPQYPNYIELDDIRAEGFEKEDAPVEHQILHEGVHWGRHHAHKPGEITPLGFDSPQEAGNFFEFRAGFTKRLSPNHGTKTLKR